MKPTYKLYRVLLIIIALLYGCAGGVGTPPPEFTPDEPRPHDTRVFTISEAALPFGALAGSTVETDRWHGVLGNSGYRVEVPKTGWNGMLVMYAHGYAGTGAALPPTSMPAGLRRWLLDNRYAWAAASFSKNYYDVRAGIEDTNALAKAFTSIAASNGRHLATPSKIYIIGHSMGGHIASAAVEEETFRTAVNKVRYNGALSLCGVVGDMELFDFFVAAQLAAQYLAGYPATAFPSVYPAPYADIAASVSGALFTKFPSSTAVAVTTAKGTKFKGVMMNLTGGNNPLFEVGFNGGFAGATLPLVFGTFGGDGTISGILNKQGTDTNSIIYQLDADPKLSAEEWALNVSIVRATAAPDANRLRTDGLRWVPKVNGDFNVPVVSLHTLGDMYVPFKMQQIYFNRSQTRTGKNWLVQRAIRGRGHCDFTVAEQVKALEDMLKWEQQGIKPAGDDVVTAATVAAATYGCTFTINTTGVDDSAATIAARAALALSHPCN